VAEAGIEKGQSVSILAQMCCTMTAGGDRSVSDLRRVYADLGINGSVGEFHFAFTGAANDFGAVGPRQSSFWHGDGRVFSRNRQARHTSSVSQRTFRQPFNRNHFTRILTLTIADSPIAC